MGFKLSLILGGLLLASISGSAIYIKYLHNQMAILQGNQIVLETKIDEQNASIENYLAKRPELIDVSTEPKLVIDGKPELTGTKKM